MGYARPLKSRLWGNHMDGSSLKLSATCTKLMLLWCMVTFSHKTKSRNVPHLNWLTYGGMGCTRPLKFLLWRNHMSGSIFKVSATTCKELTLHLESGLSID